MKIKICSKCCAPKPLAEFSKDVRRKDGYQSYCKLCLKLYFDARYRKAHPKPEPGTRCGKMIKRGIMTEKRPCICVKNHQGPCSPDLTGLIFHNLQVIDAGKPGPHYRTWNCRDNLGQVRLGINAASLTSGDSRGIKTPYGAGFVDKRYGYRVISYQGNQILEHRHVMSQILGRPLRSDEQVHHGPKGRACNDPDNLSIRLVGKHPKGHSAEELADWLRSLGWAVTPPQRVQP